MPDSFLLETGKCVYKEVFTETTKTAEKCHFTLFLEQGRICMHNKVNKNFLPKTLSLSFVLTLLFSLSNMLTLSQMTNRKTDKLKNQIFDLTFHFSIVAIRILRLMTYRAIHSGHLGPPWPQPTDPQRLCHLLSQRKTKSLPKDKSESIRF